MTTESTGATSNAHAQQIQENLISDEEYARRLQQQEFGTFFSFAANANANATANPSLNHNPMMNNNTHAHAHRQPHTHIHANTHPSSNPSQFSAPLLSSAASAHTNPNPHMDPHMDPNNATNTSLLSNSNADHLNINMNEVQNNDPNHDGNNNEMGVNGGRNAGRAIRRDVINSVRSADTESARVLLFRSTLALIELIATAVILSIGWNESSLGSECSALKYWVLIYTLRQLISIPIRIYIYRLIRSNNANNNGLSAEKSLQMLRWISIMTFLWFLVGQTFLFTGKSCQSSSPVVWYYCLTIIILVYVSLALPFLIVLAICICLPCVLIVFRFFAEPEGAPDNVIQKLPTRKVTANELHNRGADADADDDDSRSRSHSDSVGDAVGAEEDPSCAICMQDYQVDDELRVLPCGHEFHCECVDKWLPMKKICPLCRHDITKPMETKPHQSQGVLIAANNNNNNHNAEEDDNNGNHIEEEEYVNNAADDDENISVLIHDEDSTKKNNNHNHQQSLAVMQENSPPPYSSLIS